MKGSKNRVNALLLLFTLMSTSVIVLNSMPVEAVTILNVPSDSYPTIQSALNAAKDGDTIKVAAGIYNENINYTGYSIMVASGASGPIVDITLQGETGTVINGNVILTFLSRVKVDKLTITGNLTFGDSSMYGYVVNSTLSDVQVASVTIIGGFYNSITGSSFNGGLTLKGGNTKWEAPSYQTIITNNQIKNGIAIKRGSFANIIQGNTILDGEVGIFEESSTMYSLTGRNQIINNTITDNNVGLSLYSSTGDNQAPSHEADKIIQNIIADNNLGIEISASSNYPIGNTLYHNNFFNNGHQVKVNNPVSNVWDDGASPSKGNYWSDYAGLDGNGDGVGDQPYIVNSENKDNYPLLRPYSAPSLSSPSPTQPTESANPSSSTSNSLQTQQPSPSNTPTKDVSTGTNQEQNSVIPELTPITAFIALISASFVVLILKRKKALTF